MRVFTVGHGTRPIEELLTVLGDAGVRTLVDVRRYPGSRRHPQFGRDALAAGLATAGVAYRHDERLGGRRRPRADSPNSLWRNDQFRGYADHMATPEFRRALAELLREAAARPTTVMCAEAVPWRCHRQLLADAVVLGGVPVLHLLDAASAKPHAVNPAARQASDGSVTYPGTSQLGLPGLTDG